jgi:hypothetical protein
MFHEGFTIKCSYCGLDTAGRKPHFPRRHRIDDKGVGNFTKGEPCPGNTVQGTRVNRGQKGKLIPIDGGKKCKPSSHQKSWKAG